MSKVIELLQTRLSKDAVLLGDDVTARTTSYWDSSPNQAMAIVRPESTEQVSDVLKICYQHKQSVVFAGGLTGLVEGAVATHRDIILSLERMNQIEVVDELDNTVVVQAGAVLQHVQETLAEQGFLFPVDLGARGSCTIGGNIATNAGGVNVLRYGMMRNQVLGLEAVLADGTVISSMNQMLKNNTGYDLKQLFIGSEGTLGVVTRAVLRLYPMPTNQQTALIAVNSFAAVTTLLQVMRSELAGTLSAYEVMWNNYYRDVTAEGFHRAPLDRDHPYYVLVQAEGVDKDADAERFERVLAAALEEGSIRDAVVAKSEAERQALWVIREEFDALLPAYHYDVSMPKRHMEDFVNKLKQQLSAWRDETVAYVFGHVADGNLHVFVTPFDDDVYHDEVDEIVYGCLEGLSGSVSAEHGIGKQKTNWLANSRTQNEINLMRQLKAMIDPQNILNPGVVFGG